MDTVDRLLARAEALEVGQAFFVAPDLLVARSRSGLRLAGGDFSRSWYRGDFATLLTEAVETSSDWTRAGYFAHRFVREAETAADGGTPTFAIHGIGRQFPTFNRLQR